tara:strand:- start:617 stop:1162 length:546 start_codon:yes stop_codon:yes gene_type:complete
MKSEIKENPSNKFLKNLLLISFVLIFLILLIFKNTLFKSTLILKSFGELTIDPEIALTNNKPTFLEFYAEWCEICREMAPNIINLKESYADDINFVFLNVDNPKWEKYIKKFDVNGIPQINLLNADSNLNATFIGLQNEVVIEDALASLEKKYKNINSISNTNFSEIKSNISSQVSARSHG